MQEKESIDNLSFYKDLGVSQKADNDEIRKAYKKKIKDLHPDKGGDPEKFKKIQEIYENPKNSRVGDLLANLNAQGAPPKFATKQR